MAGKRRNHGATFKAKVALAEIKGDKTLAELPAQFQAHQSRILAWKQQLQERAESVFSQGERKAEPGPTIKGMQAKTGQLSLENDFFVRRARSNRRCGRKEMIGAAHGSPVVRQRQILGLPRSGVYYRPTEASAQTLTLMRRIGELHMRFPFYGSRKLVMLPRREGFQVGRRRIQTLMRETGIEALYCKPNLPKPNKAHKTWPYLLRDLVIDRPDRVWCADITYIPPARGFAYLVALMDWHPRKVLSWRLSNTAEGGFCVEALQEALDRHGRPEIFNTGQGSQFTGGGFTKPLPGVRIRISMDGKGRWMDNVFIGRLWRSLKYEDVYLKAYGSIPDAKRHIGGYFGLYNRQRPHKHWRTGRRTRCSMACENYPSRPEHAIPTAGRPPALEARWRPPWISLQPRPATQEPHILVQTNRASSSTSIFLSYIAHS